MRRNNGDVGTNGRGQVQAVYGRQRQRRVRALFNSAEKTLRSRAARSMHLTQAVVFPLAQAANWRACCVASG